MTVKLPISTLFQIQLRQRSSHITSTITPSHSQTHFTAHSSSQSQSIIMSSSELIPMQHVYTRNPHDQAEPSDEQYLRVPPPAHFSLRRRSHPIYTQSYAIGDAVYFQDSHAPYIFLGMTSRPAYHDRSRVEYEAEFKAPSHPDYPTHSIRLTLSHKMRVHDHIPLYLLGILSDLFCLFCSFSSLCRVSLMRAYSCHLCVTFVTMHHR